jgi:hypothetical protein
MGHAIPVSLYLLDLDLSTVAERTVLCTMVDGIPPLCILSSSCSSMLRKVLSVIVEM